MHERTLTVRLNHTDAAGVIYFGRLFELCQEVVEDFLQGKGFGPADMVKHHDYVTPIVHAEADFLKPMRAGDSFKAQAKVVRVGDSSFSVGFSFINERNELAARATMVHATIDKKSGEKRSLPSDFKAELQKNF